MDPDPKRPSRPKGRFKPKPPRKAPVTVPPTQIESSNDDDDSDDAETLKSLQRKLNDHLARRRPKLENKSPVQVAFGGATSESIMTFGKQKKGTEDGKEGANTEAHPLDDRKRSLSVESQMSRAVTSVLSEGTDEAMEDLLDPITVDNEKKKRDYQEPWDYEHSHYPTTLPWRKPYSGDPEVLDKAEFEVEAEYDENSINPASELGLMEQDGTPKLLLFQVPPLPLGRAGAKASAKPLEKATTTAQNSLGSTSKGKEIALSSPRVSTVAKEKGIAGSSISQLSSNPSTQTCNLKDMPEGYMGKMIVYKSGAVKLKIGDILYDVSPGITSTFPQDVMAFDTRSQNSVRLGEIEKRAVVIPDVDSILDRV